MASSPRTRPAPGPIVAGLFVVALLLALAVAVAFGVDVAGTLRGALDSMFPPAAATDRGVEIRNLYDLVFFFAAAIFVLVEGLIIWTVIRYRRKPGDDELPAQTHGNNLAEVTWTVVPTVVVAILFFFSWQTLNKVEAVSDNPTVQVKAVAGQFQWTFVYLAEDGVTEEYTQFLPTGENGGLTLPVGVTVKVLLQSPDVIHAFYVPRFLFKRDVVPGQTNVFEFTINESEAGQTFRGQCAELCGAGHRVMTFDVHALTKADYDAWLANAIESAQPPPDGSAPPPAATLDLVASGIKFDKAQLEAPADEPFAIALDNQDASVPHDVDVLDAGGASVFDSSPFPGPKKQTFNVPPLAAGTYKFLCSVHPTTMSGTLAVQ